MTPLVILGRQAVSYGLGLAVTRLLSLLALPILTAYLSAPDYGLVMLLAVLGIILRMVFGVGSSGAAGIVYFRHDDPTRRQRVVWSLALLLLCGGLGGVLIPQLLFVNLHSLVFQDAPEITRTIIFCFTSSVALQLAAEAFLLYLQFLGNARRYAVVSVSGAIAGMSASVYLVAVANMGVEGWVYGQLLGSVILFAMAFGGVGSMLGRPSFNQGDAIELVRIWSPLLPGGVAVLIMMNASPYFVGKFADISAAGRFGVGYQLGMGMALATSAISSAWVPFFQGYVNRQGEASSIFPRLVQIYLAGMGGVTLLFFVLAYPVVSWLTPAEYREAWTVVGFIALGQMLMGLWGMLLPGMYYSGETGWVAILQILACIVTLLVYLAAIERFGLVGGGGIVVGIVWLIVMQLVVNRWRAYQVRVIEPRRFIGTLLLLLLSCGVVWFVWQESPGGLYAWGMSGLIVSIYLLLSVLTVPSVMTRK